MDEAVRSGVRRVLVAGSRNWDDKAEIGRALWAEFEQMDGSMQGTLVHGACPTGADAIAASFGATFSRVVVEPHPADWDTHGASAGFRRNEEMVDLGADLVLVFLRPCRKATCKRQGLHYSHGACDTANRAVKAGLVVREWYQP